MFTVLEYQFEPTKFQKQYSNMSEVKPKGCVMFTTNQIYLLNQIIFVNFVTKLKYTVNIAFKLSDKIKN